MIPDNLKVIILLTLMVGAVIAFWYGFIIIAGGKIVLYTIATIGAISIILNVLSMGNDIVRSVTGEEEKK